MGTTLAGNTQRTHIFIKRLTCPRNVSGTYKKTQTSSTRTMLRLVQGQPRLIICTPENDSPNPTSHVPYNAKKNKPVKSERRGMKNAILCFLGSKPNNPTAPHNEISSREYQILRRPLARKSTPCNPQSEGSYSAGHKYGAKLNC